MEPVPRETADNWWMNRHRKVLETIKTKKTELILIGNSILNLLDDSSRAEVWDVYLNKYNTVNMGFSGDRTENVLWRLQNGEIDGINPKVALVLIGTNNTDGNHYLSITPPEELSEAIWAICRVIRKKLPETKILLLGIFPYGRYPNYRNHIITKTNSYLEKFPERDDMIRYKYIGNIFLDENGKIDKSLLYDYLHPSPKGHMLMFKALENDIDELMK
jgi:beta-glucosidase